LNKGSSFNEHPRSAIGSWDKPPSRLKGKARGHKDDRSVLIRTVRSPLADNAVIPGESAVSNSIIAELGEHRGVEVLKSRIDKANTRLIT